MTTVLFAAALVPSLIGFRFGFLRGRWDIFWPLNALSCAFGLAANILRSDWPWCAIDSASLILSVWCWDQGRRKRRKCKVSALIGAKSRAIRDAIVRKARESAKPEPLLRPVPGGAS